MACLWQADQQFPATSSNGVYNCATVVRTTQLSTSATGALTHQFGLGSTCVYLGLIGLVASSELHCS